MLIGCVRDNSFKTKRFRRSCVFRIIELKSWKNRRKVGARSSEKVEKRGRFSPPSHHSRLLRNIRRNSMTISFDRLEKTKRNGCRFGKCFGKFCKWELFESLKSDSDEFLGIILDHPDDRSLDWSDRSIPDHFYVITSFLIPINLMISNIDWIIDNQSHRLNNRSRIIIDFVTA